MLTFRYSWVYDQTWKNFLKVNSAADVYPASEETRRSIGRIGRLWYPLEGRIISAISESSHLRWKVGNIDCYLVGRCRPISDPLTIMPFRKDNEIVNTLTHELIHQIMIQNSRELRIAREFINNKYGEESQITLNHIFLFAVYAKIYPKVLEKRELGGQILQPSERDYARAWEIVNKEGYENIILEVVNRLTDNKTSNG
ncbi:MAG: hypothetical protein KGH59_03735 [Candidatus Micrarchaeota archaeon]|nr:hypothetical protein [Candidatus Micrarchaeota archaeon]